MLALICAIGAFLPAGPAATGVRSRAAVRVEPKTSMVALDRRAVALGALAAAMTPLASQAKFVDLRDTDAAPATASKPAAASKPASKPTSKPAPKPAAKKTPPKPVDPKVAAARAKQERKVQAAKNKMAAKEKTRTAQQARDKAAKDAAAKRAAAETAQKAKAREAKRVALVAKQSQKQQAAKNKLAKKKKGGGASACLDPSTSGSIHRLALLFSVSPRGRRIDATSAGNPLGNLLLLGGAGIGGLVLLGGDE